MARKARQGAALADETRRNDGSSPRLPRGQQRRILYVTPEIAEYAKAGGLGDVSASLPRILRAYCDVRVLVPGYRDIVSVHREMHLVGRLGAAFGLPPCDIGRI
jgi:starch synthase